MPVHLWSLLMLSFFTPSDDEPNTDWTATLFVVVMRAPLVLGVLYFAGRLAYRLITPM
jgi:hypothetical protein